MTPHFALTQRAVMPLLVPVRVAAAQLAEEAQRGESY